MSSPDELRSYAVDCARLASAAIDPHDKERLLNMARAWTDLAERVERIGRTAANISLPEAPMAESPPPSQPE